MTLPAKTEGLEQVTAFLDGILDEAGCAAKQRMLLEIALEEVYVNVANYAYPEGTEGTATVDIDLLKDPAGILIRISDSGAAFNPLDKKDPDITESVEKRPIGGLGIYMVKKTMDEVRYSRTADQNCFTMIKYFS